MENPCPPVSPFYVKYQPICDETPGLACIFSVGFRYNSTLTGIPAYSVPSSATSVGIECSRQADILVVEVRPHQPAALPTSLAEGF